MSAITTQIDPDDQDLSNGPHPKIQVFRLGRLKRHAPENRELL